MRLSAQFIVCSAKGLLLGLFIASTALAQTKPKVAFVPQIVGIPYFNAMEEGGKDAAEKFGVEFIYSGPTDTNPAEQLRIVNGLIDQGVNAVSLSVLDPVRLIRSLIRQGTKESTFSPRTRTRRRARGKFMSLRLSIRIWVLRSLTNSRSGLESKAKWELFPAKRLRRT
jgi:Periplasmic binding protein domain